MSNTLYPLGPDALQAATVRKDSLRTDSARASASIATRLLREPLLHFCILGGLIFAIDARLRPPVRDEHVIVVTKALRQSFMDGFSEDKDRTPTPDEMQKMVDSWVASEILYKEGKAAGVDRGDQTIRDRIAYKLQLLIFDQIKVDRPTPDQLKTWFATNHGRFDQPARVSFYMTPPTDEATARRHLQEILGQHEDASLEKQTTAILARPEGTVAQAFGDSFLSGLLAAAPNQWTVLQSKDGWQVVRLDGVRPGHAAKLEDVVDDASRIWHDDEVRRRAWEAVTRLKTSYKVRVES